MTSDIKSYKFLTKPVYFLVPLFVSCCVVGIVAMVTYSSKGDDINIPMVIFFSLAGAAAFISIVLISSRLFLEHRAKQKIIQQREIDNRPRLQLKHPLDQPLHDPMDDIVLSNFHRPLNNKIVEVDAEDKIKKEIFVEIEDFN